jgi:hypothetical protein
VRLAEEVVILTFKKRRNGLDILAGHDNMRVHGDNHTEGAGGRVYSW